MPHTRSQNQTTRRKKKPSAYALWIKANYDSVRHLQPRERISELGKRWRALKKQQAK